MVDYAYKQLDLAVSKWEEVSTIDPGYTSVMTDLNLIISKHFFYFRSLEERYNLASVTRNNLVASAQNIQGAQRYLSNIAFPYCSPPEVETLNKVLYLYRCFFNLPLPKTYQQERRLNLENPISF